MAIGADAAADSVGGFEEKEGETGGMEMDGGGEACETGADDHRTRWFGGCGR